MVRSDLQWRFVKYGNDLDHSSLVMKYTLHLVIVFSLLGERRFLCAHTYAPALATQYLSVTLADTKGHYRHIVLTEALADRSTQNTTFARSGMVECLTLDCRYAPPPGSKLA